MIDSPQNSRIKEAAKLRQKKYRRKQGRLLVSGVHLVEEAERHGLIRTVFTLGRNRTDGVAISEAAMKRLTGMASPPDAAAVVKMPSPGRIGNRVLFLEHIQDPGNVGTLLRSALAFGFRDVVLDSCADPFSDKVLRATQGSIFALNLHETTVADFVANHPHTLIAATPRPEGTSTIPSEPLALMLGNEGSGLSSLAAEQSDIRLHIPTEGVESLNVAVAGGILMFRVREALCEG